MHPEICKIGPITVYSYGLMLVSAFFISSVLASLRARKELLEPDLIFNLCFVSFIFGVIGARALYVIEHISEYIRNPLELIMFQHGGLSWFGGLILGSLSAVIYLRKKKAGVLRILDLLAPFICLAQAIGRIGCLFNGCCFGKESAQHGIYFPVHDAVLIPAQIYSSILLVLIFIILRFLQDSPHKIGQVFFTYLALYSVKRFFIEFLRADNDIVFMGFTLFQLLSVILFICSIYKLFSIAKSKR